MFPLTGEFASYRHGNCVRPDEAVPKTPTPLKRKANPAQLNPGQNLTLTFRPPHFFGQVPQTPRLVFLHVKGGIYFSLEIDWHGTPGSFRVRYRYSSLRKSSSDDGSGLQPSSCRYLYYPMSVHDGIVRHGCMRSHHQ